MTRRVPSDGSPARNLTIRVYDEDREAWETAARAAGAATLSAWLIRIANEASKPQGKRSKP